MRDVFNVGPMEHQVIKEVVISVDLAMTSDSIKKENENVNNAVETSVPARDGRK